MRHQRSSACYSYYFSFNDSSTTEIYTLSLHDALPIYFSDEPGIVWGLIVERPLLDRVRAVAEVDRKSTRLNSSHVAISYAVFCLKKKNKKRSALPVAVILFIGDTILY